MGRDDEDEDDDVVIGDDEDVDDGDDDEDDGGEAPDPRPSAAENTLNYMDTDAVVSLAKRQKTTFAKAKAAMLKAMQQVVPGATGAAEDKGALTVVVGKKRLKGEALDPWIDAIAAKAAELL